jgi:glyoxylase-like metal-dependent hydrolase (beta-lactamase superfamily II)
MQMDKSNPFADGWKGEEPQTVAPGVAGMKIVFVNVYMIDETSDRFGSWVLVDAGLYGSANRIRRAAENRYGRDARPKAILLTHGHFDHVGALRELAERWDVPVYAHPLELPYLTGRSAYPPPDPTVGGGAMALLSWMYPKHPIDISEFVRPLPADGSVPGLSSDWQWVATPGHSPGHVSFFRESDRTLVVGDAFVTTKQESALAVLQQRQELHGPPSYFTPDWVAARQSVALLTDMAPQVAAAGHGFPMYGEELRASLKELTLQFDQLAVPKQGRYVEEPAITDENGVVTVPPPVGADPLTTTLLAVSIAAVAGTALMVLLRKRNQSSAGSYREAPPAYLSTPSYQTPTAALPEEEEKTYPR